MVTQPPGDRQLLHDEDVLTRKVMPTASTSLSAWNAAVTQAVPISTARGRWIARPVLIQVRASAGRR